MGEGCNSNGCADIRRLEHDLEALRTQNTETHRKLWEEINTLKTNDAVQVTKYDTILNQLNTVVSEVKALQAVPGNNWKDLSKAIVTAVGSAIGGFVLAKLGIL